MARPTLNELSKQTYVASMDVACVRHAVSWSDLDAGTSHGGFVCEQ
jgi:hypothetical protein